MRGNSLPRGAKHTRRGSAMFPELALAIWLEATYRDFLAEFSFSDTPGRRYYFVGHVVAAIERGDDANGARLFDPGEPIEDEEEN